MECLSVRLKLSTLNKVFSFVSNINIKQMRYKLYNLGGGGGGQYWFPTRFSAIQAGPMDSV